MRHGRSHKLWRGMLLTAGLASPAIGRAQVPLPPTGPSPSPVARAACGHIHNAGHPPGPLCRFTRHVKSTVKDKMIGYPEYFVEPPLGSAVRDVNCLMTARAESHTFTLYRSDFASGTATLTPAGAHRLTAMANRLPRWLGPVVVEWTPDAPGLAEARRDAILNSLVQAGLPVGPERVVVGPSPFNGLNGDEAAIAYQIYLNRAGRAPAAYSLTPNVTGTIDIGLAGRGGGGGSN
jgi:hypothetical protein